MKKVIVTGLVSVALSATLAEAKFFLGLEGEYSISSAYTFARPQGDITWGNRGFDGGPGYPFYQEWTAGINLGTEHLFNEYIGLRWLFGINYGQFVKPSEDSQQLAFQLGIDGLFNFVNTGSFSFGLFAGLGLRMNMFGPDLFATSLGPGTVVNNVVANLLGRIGFTLGFGEHNRIDIGVGIPFMSISGTEDGTLMHAPIRFNVGYKFLF